jgi:hypothetical protein
VHLVAYSFGTIVALDALFPQQQPSPRIERIDTLTTIGSPFDFLRTYWPTYFTGRQSVHGHPRRWINVYAPLDVLGSDFLDTTDGHPMRGVGLENGGERKPDKILRFGRDQKLSTMQYMGFVGFNAHSQYWEKDETSDVNCFHDVVRELYAGDPALS